NALISDKIIMDLCILVEVVLCMGGGFLSVEVFCVGGVSSSVEVVLCVGGGFLSVEVFCVRGRPVSVEVVLCVGAFFSSIQQNGLSRFTQIIIARLSIIIITIESDMAGNVM
ncbi:hypothetical protein M9458_052052, partial [Cirrhinus mrigala]